MIYQINQLLTSIAYIDSQNFQIYVGFFILPRHTHFAIPYNQINQLLKSIAYIDSQNFQIYVGFFILKLWDYWIMKLN